MIKELQETQKEEREAYQELEQAMIESSQPKRERQFGSTARDGMASVRDSKSETLPGITFGHKTGGSSFAT